MTPYAVVPRGKLQPRAEESQAILRLRRYAAGAIFLLETNLTRTSVSLCDSETGVSLAWFRKSDAPGVPWNAEPIAVLHTSGHLVICPKNVSEATVKDLALPPYKTTANEKDTTMKNFTTTLIDTNKSAAAQAGFLEAGRIANNQVVKLSSKALPLMVRGYADTPIGKLVMANVAQMAAGHLRAGDATLARLTNAMTVAAYQELIQTFDIEGWLNQVMESPEIKRAVAKLQPAEQRPNAE